MATLDKRITELETKASTDDKPKTIIITYVTPGETKPDIRKLRQSGPGYRDSGKEWVRGADESEKAFTDRASREATRNNGFALLMHCD